MRRDIDDLIAAIQRGCSSLFLLNFPTTGWFGDKTVALVEATLKRGVGRLMTTISIDGPKALHEELRGLPGSWDRGIETFRRLRGIKRSNYQAVVGMTLMEKNAGRVDETIAAIRQVIPDFQQSELHLNVGHESGHYFNNVGQSGLGVGRTVTLDVDGHTLTVRITEVTDGPPSSGQLVVSLRSLVAAGVPRQDNVLTVDVSPGADVPQVRAALERAAAPTPYVAVYDKHEFAQQLHDRVDSDRIEHEILEVEESGVGGYARPQVADRGQGCR